jgi:DNA-binding transcriptional regulator YdaS (Cro superfamily)
MGGVQLSAAVAAFRESVRRAGGQSGFERITGARQQTISYRLKKGMPVPGEYVLRAEEGTGVSRHLLRPDLYPVDHPPGFRPAGDHGAPVGAAAALTSIGRPPLPASAMPHPYRTNDASSQCDPSGTSHRSNAA